LLSGDSRLCSPRVRAPPRSPLFPYTTLFRSHPQRHRADRDRATLGRRCPAQGGVAGVSGIAGSVDHSRTSGGEGGRIVAAVIPHIMVHAVLQQAVAGFYTDLVTRPTGRAVRENIERDLPPGTVAVRDLTCVG